MNEPTLPETKVSSSQLYSVIFTFCCLIRKIRIFYNDQKQRLCVSWMNGTDGSWWCLELKLLSVTAMGDQ